MKICFEDHLSIISRITVDHIFFRIFSYVPHVHIIEEIHDRIIQKRNATSISCRKMLEKSKMTHQSFKIFEIYFLRKRDHLNPKRIQSFAISLETYSVNGYTICDCLTKMQ